MEDTQVLIIGGGIAGLCCARRLAEAGIACQVLEASDGVGGRARTDRVDGFLLDRGFQVLLTAYPEAQRVLNYTALDLQSFEPGALIWFNRKFRTFVDPLRRPSKTLATVLSPIATLGDKLRVARLRSKLSELSLETLFEREELRTIDALHNAGFSGKIIERFFRPFLSGVFLESSLDTSSRFFEFVFRMFASGSAAIPAQGMGAIAKQIADSLPADTIQLGQMVRAIKGTTVHLANGPSRHAAAIVVATDAASAARLLGDPRVPPSRAVTCVYFAADTPPINEPILVLDGERSGPVNNLCVPSLVARSYAPADQSLISCSVLGDAPEDDAALEARVRGQMEIWFGNQVRSWRHLRTYRIPNALPAQVPPALVPVAKPVQRAAHLFICGDHTNLASLQGAMASGRDAAEAVIRSLPSQDGRFADLP